MENIPEHMRQEVFSKFTELLSSSSARAKMKDETGVDFERFGQTRNREEMLEEHKAAIKDIKTKFGMVAGGMSTVSWTTNFNVKPQMGSPADWDACSPIPVASLCENTTHRSRHLRGTLVVPPLVMTSVMSLLEDEAGNLVKVGTAYAM